MFLNDNNIKVAQTDIGIVTPYKRQMHRIKECLMVRDWENIEVGTVETFQGREKRVIIITTVRAQRSLLLQNREYELGFVKSEKVMHLFKIYFYSSSMLNLFISSKNFNRNRFNSVKI